MDRDHEISQQYKAVQGMQNKPTPAVGQRVEGQWYLFTKEGRTPLVWSLSMDSHIALNFFQRKGWEISHVSIFKETR